jgi:hypothetical protein
MNPRYPRPSGQSGSLPMGGGVEEIAEPRDTRPLLVEWAGRAYATTSSQTGPRARGMRP